MKQSGAPAKIPLPWASGESTSYINTIPTPSQQSTSNPTLASWTDGFPPGTFGASGKPPYGQDVNGVLNQLSAGLQFLQSGAVPLFDATFATAIGGYPKGAVVSSSTFGNYWLSSADDNTTTPGATGANWVPIYGPAWNNQVYIDTSSTANNLSIAIPGTLQQGARLLVRVSNTNSGPTAISVNGGSGIGLLQGGAALAGNELLSGWVYLLGYDSGSMHVLGSGAGTVNVGAAASASHAVNLGQFQYTLASTGEAELPGGMLLKWGVDTPASGSETSTVTFANAFPNACLNVVISEAAANSGNWGAAPKQPTIHGVSGLTKTGFQHWTLGWSGSGWAITANSGFWQAIGW